MKLYIPEISNEIRLTKDWTFDLYNEDRNQSLMEFVGDTRQVEWYAPSQTSIPCTIPAGEILKVDRIYVRKGKSDFSSITFLWKNKRIPAKFEDREVISWEEDKTGSPGTENWNWPSLFDRVSKSRSSPFIQSTPMVKKTHIVQDRIPARPIRFWAKLSDVNYIEFEQVWRSVAHFFWKSIRALRKHPKSVKTKAQAVELYDRKEKPLYYLATAISF